MICPIELITLEKKIIIILVPTATCGGNHYSVPPFVAFVATLLIGILTGLFGIGGGALMTPS
jgi:hypothetical protein